MTREPVCAICGKPQAAKFKPFCSARCADIDLNRWLKGTYAIPGKPTGDEDEGEDQPRRPADDDT